MADTTTIQISMDTWQQLKTRKQGPNDTFDDVLQRLLHEPECETQPDEPVDDTPTPTPVREDNEADDVRQAVEAVDVPAGKDVDECVAAVRAAVEFVERKNGATKREIVGTVMPEHSLGYQVPDLTEGKRYRGAWWRRVVKPSLEQLDDVESPPVGGSEWTFSGEK